MEVPEVIQCCDKSLNRLFRRKGKRLTRQKLLDSECYYERMRGMKKISGALAVKLLKIPCAVVFSALLMLICASPVSTQVNGISLTGTWTAGNLGVFFIRQIGNEVWWLGEDDPLQPSWCNVGHGTVTDRTLTVEWTDIPKGTSRSRGTVVINIAHSNKLEVISQKGGFAVKEMTKSKPGVEME